MSPLQALLIGVLAPAGLALAVAGAVGWFGAASPRRAALGTALALAAAYALMFELVLGWPALPPVDATHMSPWAAVVAVVLVAATGRAPGWVRGAVSAASGLGLGVWLSLPLVPHALSPELAALATALTGALFVTLDRGLAWAVSPLEARAGAGVVASLAGGAALAILLSDVASLGQVTGGLAAAAGALVALGLVRPGAVDVGRATLVVAAVLTPNLVSAVLYANGRVEVVALIALAPLVLVPLRGLVTRPRRALVRLALPALVTVVPVAGAAAWAARSYLAAPEAVPAPAAGESTGTSAVPASSGTDGYDPNYGY